MARESASILGSGVQVLRHTHNMQFITGTNTVVVNPEDINSCLGLFQANTIQVDDNATNLTSGILPGRRKVWVKNLDTTTVFVGASGVTTDDGYPLQQNEEIKLDIIGFGSPFAITASATINVHVLQLA